MTQQVALRFAMKTDTGLVRSHNEDAIDFSEECRIAVLADGMGGYNAGEIASGIATATFKDVLERRLKEIDYLRRVPSNKVLQRLLAESTNVANMQILEAARNQPEFSGMGTTLVAALFHQDRVAVVHLGDSRVYQLRRGKLTQLTRDHSQLQEQIDAGLISPEWARFAPNKNLITRALGVVPQIDIDTDVHAIEAGDLYLLCSDGLSDMLSDQQMIDIASQNAELDDCCAQLVEAANNNGGRDNISIILVRIDSPGAIKPLTIFSRAKSWFKQSGRRSVSA